MQQQQQQQQLQHAAAAACMLAYMQVVLICVHAYIFQSKGLCSFSFLVIQQSLPSHLPASPETSLLFTLLLLLLPLLLLLMEWCLPLPAALRSPLSLCSSVSAIFCLFLMEPHRPQVVIVSLCCSVW